MKSVGSSGSKGRVFSVFVDCVPWRCCFMWPLAVAGAFGQCFCRAASVRPGMLLTYLSLIARSSVECTGEKNAAW